MNEAVALVAQAVATSSAARLVRRGRRRAPRGGGRPRLRQERIGVASPMPREPRLHHRDQRRDGGERELEADAEDRLGLDRDDREHREREIAHGQRAPVEDDRAEHDQRHDQRALGADARAGRDVVEERADHRDARRPFLDRIVERQRRRQRQQAARDDEEDAGDQRHLHAGNRDDVEDAGLADEVLGVVGEEVALARHHGGGDRALVAADDRVRPGAPGGCARGRSPRRSAGRRLASPGGGRTLDRAERRADRADAGEIGVAGEVVAAGQRRRARAAAAAPCSATKSPAATSGVLRVVTRTRRGTMSAGMPSAIDDRDRPSARRPAGSRPPRRSPCSLTMRMWSSIGASTRAVRSDIDRKPAHSAASAEREAARERPRAADPGEAGEEPRSARAGSHSTGSRSAARLSATPPIAATGIHRKKRRSSTSRASAPGEGLAPVRRVVRRAREPAAADRTPARAGVDMRHS